MRLFARVGVGDVRMFCTGFAFGGGRLLDRVCAPVFLPLVLAYTFLSTQIELACHQSSMKFIKSKQKPIPKPTLDVGAAEDKLFKYFISYALLVAYVVAAISSTTDLMLLQSVDGMRLPFIDSKISIRSFFVSAPIIVAAASLFMAREFLILNIRKKKQLKSTDFVFSLPRRESSDRIFGVNGDLDKIALKIVSYLVFFLLGPVVILLITLRFADYQDKLVFLFHISIFAITAYLSWVFYRRVEQLHAVDKIPVVVELIGYVVVFAIGLKLLICIDVVLVPSKYSPTMYIKQNTKLLDDYDGGTLFIVPHLTIDRAISVSGVKTKEDLEKFRNPLSKEYFPGRAGGIDLRGRNLKYLDIPFQIAPRMWAHDADLSGANLSFARLMSSNFVNTNFYGATFTMSVLDGSSFFSANMEEAKIVNSYFRGTIFDGIKLSRVFLDSVSFVGSSFFGVEVKDSVLDGVDFSGVDFLKQKYQIVPSSWTFQALFFQPPWLIGTNLENFPGHSRRMKWKLLRLFQNSFAKRQCHFQMSWRWKIS